MTDEEYFKDEEFREMLADYERTVQSGQLVFMDVDDLADIADYYQFCGRHDDAQQAIDRAIELDPGSLFALNYRIHEALDKRDYTTAEELLSQMPDELTPEYTYSRAETWLAQGQTDKADDYLRQCLKELPSDERQDFIIDVANLYSEYGDSEKSLEWMMRAHPEETDDFKELMGRTYFGMGAYDDSEKIFKELLDKHPFQKRYWNALANTQYMKEDYSASVDSSEFAIAIDPEDPDALMAKANGLFRLENYEEALKFYERYSEKVPDDEFSLLHQGCCLVYLQRYPEAEQQLEKALQKAPKDSPYLLEIYQELAFAYGDDGKIDEAMKTLNETDNLECDYNDLLVVRGHILLSNGFIEEGEAAFRKAIIGSKNAPLILLRVAVSIYDCHYLDSAYRLFKHLFDYVKEDFDQGYSYMALCCHSMKRYDEYLEYLKKAVSCNPDEAKATLSHLFPEDISPEQYYEYAQKELKNVYNK